MMIRPTMLLVLMFAFLSAADAQPTISGVNAFWYLGGVASDHGYYATALLTANPNGATGSITWSEAGSGAGSVGLSCYTNCTDTVTATSYHASSGCASDVVVYVTIGGSQSPTFPLTIVAPTTTTLLSGYPTDTTEGTGYASYYYWSLTDSCGNPDAGLDQNEEFGTWTNDYAGTDWNHPSLGPVYDATAYVNDVVSNGGGYSAPPAEPPQVPLTTIKVIHDTPWLLFVGSQTSGTGVQIHSDLQQWYQDHGRHQ